LRFTQLNSRWLALTALVSVAASGLIWYTHLAGGWQSLLLIVPLLIYVGRIKQPVTIPAGLQLLLSLFFLTVFSGWLVAYDQQAATTKFWMLASAILLFITIALQPAENWSAVIWVLVCIGAGYAIYFLLAYNWFKYPADIDLLNRVGQGWMSIRPSLSLKAPQANLTAGILAVFFLFSTAVGREAWTHRKWFPFILQAIMGGLMLVALLLTSSRAAWGALIIGFIVWGWWKLSHRIPLFFGRKPIQIFQIGLGVVALVGLLTLALFPSEIYSLAKALPGTDSAQTRAGLFLNAVQLIPDFWLTGGGLKSFAGLYSQYILVLPFLYFRYAHNLYLDLAIEQGVFGLIFFLAIYAWTLLLLLRKMAQPNLLSETERIFYPALFSAFVVLLGHGLFDDAFYGMTSSPFLFALPGLAISLAGAKPGNTVDKTSWWMAVYKSRSFLVWGIAVLIVFIGLSLANFHTMAGAVLANLGAVKMAKIELADFPRETWDDGSRVSKLSGAEGLFKTALWYNPDQPVANYRLGLIAMQQGDYGKAVEYLESAHHTNANHRGVRKSLGYAYVWLGDFDRAYKLIEIFPEAAREMESYASWWLEKNDTILAERAVQIQNYLR
jgi:putative inorganic carbon (hco3(-)) transporter